MASTKVTFLFAFFIISLFPKEIHHSTHTTKTDESLTQDPIKCRSQIKSTKRIEHTARSLCNKFTSCSKWSQSKESISKFGTSEDFETGFVLLTPEDAGIKVIGRFKALEFDVWLLLGTFFVSASVRAKIQSAADTASRDGNSNPPCKVLQKHAVKQASKERKHGINCNKWPAKVIRTFLYV